MVDFRTILDCVFFLVFCTGIIFFSHHLQVEWKYKEARANYREANFESYPDADSPPGTKKRPVDAHYINEVTKAQAARDAASWALPWSFGLGTVSLIWFVVLRLGCWAALTGASNLRCAIEDGRLRAQEMRVEPPEPDSPSTPPDSP